MTKNLVRAITLGLLCALPYATAYADVYEKEQDWSSYPQDNISKYQNYKEDTPTTITVKDLTSNAGNGSYGNIGLRVGFNKNDATPQTINLDTLKIVMKNNKGDNIGIKAGEMNQIEAVDLTALKGTNIEIQHQQEVNWDPNQVVGVYAYSWSVAGNQHLSKLNLGENSFITINSIADDTDTLDDTSKYSSRGASGIWNKNAVVSGKNITISINKALDDATGRYHVYGVNHNKIEPTSGDDPTGDIQNTDTLFTGNVVMDLNSLGKAYGYYNYNEKSNYIKGYKSKFQAGNLAITLQSQGLFDSGENEKNLACGLYSYNLFNYYKSHYGKESNQNSKITVDGDTVIDITALNNAIGTGMEFYGVDQAEFKGSTGIKIVADGVHSATRGLRFNNSNVDMGEVALSVTANNGSADGLYIDNDITQEHVREIAGADQYIYRDFFTTTNLKSLVAQVKGAEDSNGVRALSKLNIDGNLQLDVVSDNGEAAGIRVGVSDVTTSTNITDRYNVTAAEGDVTIAGASFINVIGGTDAYGIVAENKVYNSENYGGKATFKEDVILNVVGTNSATGVYSKGDGSVITFEKGLLLNASEKNKSSAAQDQALVIENGGKIIINSGGSGDVVLKGDIAAINSVGNTDKGSIDINFATAGSEFNGASTITGTDSAIDLTFAKGALWNVSGDSSLTNLTIADGGIVDLSKTTGFATVTAKELKGDNGIIKMTIDGNGDSDKLVLESHTGQHILQLNNTGNDYENAKGTVVASVGTESGSFGVEDSEGKLYWTKTILDNVQNGNQTDWLLDRFEKIDPSEKETASVSAIMSNNALNYHTWRTENDRLMQRMGELRYNGEEAQGVWVRASGSKISRSGSFDFKNQYTTYELGYDTMSVNDENGKRYAGIALSYGDGKSSYDRGSGKNHSKAINFYGTQVGNKGHYVDLVFKIANLDNDYQVYDYNNKKVSGEYQNTGVSLSTEYGRKHKMENNWYLEPQAQFTLGYLGGDNYVSSNDIQISQSGIVSAVGRLGLNIGKEFKNNGVVYLKANVLYEFGGDYDVTMSSGSDSLKKQESFGDTWFEYGIGAALKTSANDQLYFDVERSSGSDFKKDWRWNIGLRHSF